MKPTYLILASLSLTNAAPPDDDIHRLGKALARFQGCFLQRAWQDLQHIQCQKGNVVDCLCRSQDQLSSLIRRDFDICIDPSLPFSGVLKQAGADISGIGLSALCGAYEGRNSPADDGSYAPNRRLKRQDGDICQNCKAACDAEDCATLDTGDDETAQEKCDNCVSFCDALCGLDEPAGQAGEAH